jgi:8-oxo-dGTP pyrophosphatase MutT (NUDIX family)
MDAALLAGHPEAAAVPPLLRALAAVLARRAEHSKPPKPRPRRRAAAVLVLFYQKRGELHIVMFRRTERVTTHKGQVSFPGGSADPGDKNMPDTALRESQEELGIDSTRVVLLGEMETFDTFVSNFTVTPFCGYYLDADPIFVPTDYEVEEVLEVPVARLRDPKNRRVGKVPGFNVPFPLPYYRLDGTIIWGASGGIVDELLVALDQADHELAESRGA